MFFNERAAALYQAGARIFELTNISLATTSRFSIKNFTYKTWYTFFSQTMNPNPNRVKGE